MAITNYCKKFIFFLSLVLLGCQTLADNEPVIEVNRVIATAKDTMQIIELNRLGQQYWATDFTASRYIFNTSLRISKTLKKERFQSTTLIYLGFAYSNGPYKDSARIFYNRALDINKRIRNLKGMAQCYNSLGSLEIKLGNYDNAVKYVMQALKVAEENKDSLNISKAYNSLGVLYDEQEMHHEAILNYNKSLQVKRALNDKNGQAMTLNNLGNVHKSSHQFDSSLFYYNQAEVLLKDLNNPASLAMLYGNIAGLYTLKENYDEAISYLKKATVIYNETDDIYGKATTLYNLGNIYQMKGDRVQALKTLKECESSAILSGSKELQKDIYHAFATLYADQGDYRNGYLYMSKFNALKDSITSEANARMINEISTRYETGQKEKTIALLNKDKNLKELRIKEQERFQFFLFAFIALGAVLGIVLLKGYLNKKRSNLLLEKQKLEINQQKELLEEKNNDITDSINYAQRLQRSILPSNTYLKNHLPEHFLLYRPKDIVSGDFYWSADRDNKILFAVADCTGHGVPGAFMSILGSNLLNEIVIDKNIISPEIILDTLRESVIRTLNAEDAEYKSMDGMDISLIVINKASGELTIANANNPVWIYSEGDITEIKADKYPVGFTYDGDLRPFTLKKYQTKPGDVIFLFSDGYADQFGGEQGKKFKYKPLKELLLSIGHKRMNDQCHILEETFDTWKGSLQQVDDVLIAGIRA